MHIGLIPDGNRRHMKKEQIGLKKAYQGGIAKFYDFLEWCIELGMKEVTIYALSIENIKNRSKSELKLLFDLFSDVASRTLNDKRIHDNQVHINICGDRSLLPDNVVRNLEEMVNSTQEYENLTLNLAIAYGGRQEIISAVKKVIANKMEVNEENIMQNLWVNSYPDLIIRTGEYRTSNFLVWQSAYSEIYFSEKLWPEFEREDLLKIVENYEDRERRFGR